MKKGITWLAACMLILVLTACGGVKQSAESGSNGSDADAGVTASEELVIKASNYEFDQPEYHLKKAFPLTLFIKMKTEITVSWCLS